MSLPSGLSLSPPVRHPVPAAAGLSLKPQHADAIRARRPAIGFFEIHAENHMLAGGPMMRLLDEIATDYPISVHGVGLSLGGPTPPDRDHLKRLAALVARVQPGLVSEHIAWSAVPGRVLGDLLPVPYDEASLRRLTEHVDAVQSALKRRILMENPSRYVRFAADRMSEPAFLAELVARTGCGLLVDVTNILISACNHHTDPCALMDPLPAGAIGEIHVAGHAVVHEADGGVLLVDDHGSAVPAPVWALLRRLVSRIGPRPTLIEWDTDVPAFAVLEAEADIAGRILEDAMHPVPGGRHDL
ncbi:MNIO family bufferin maturase [Segnochrobactraceae bacterium EtOH-i3]